MSLVIRILAPLASLRLAMFCLSAAMILVFAGTMAQRTLDIHIVQTNYFQSWIVWWQASPGSLRFPVFPGGHLIGAVLLANLLASLVVRFKLSLAKAGFQIIHLGLIILLVGGLATDLFSVHSFMRLYKGETKNFSEDEKRMELAVIGPGAGDLDAVTAIPGERLAKGGEITHESLPFRFVVRGFYKNSALSSAGAGMVPAASKGTGATVSVTPRPPATGINQRDVMSAVLEIVPTKGGDSLGTWLVSDMLASAQEVAYEGKTWTIQLRPVRYYRPYSLTLLDFTHKVYAGSSIPKDFSSYVVLDHPAAGERREVRIFMNNPLRYEGDTYYQSSFTRERNGTVLQVVRNPGHKAPYVACAVISLGMLWQFTYHLIAFISRRKKQPRAADQPAPAGA